MDLTIIIFLLVYVAMGVGHLPGLRLDRTGTAIVGAMILLVAGRITPAAAWNAIDYRSIGLLFGLMVVSAAFSVAGFYDWVAQRVGAMAVGPKALLAVMIAVAAGMAALLNKDVVAVAMAPVFCSICLNRKLNPLPYLLAFCFAANFGSCLTLIGSPQSMIVAETLHLSFVGFSRAAALPALVGLPVIWIVLVCATAATGSLRAFRRRRRRVPRQRRRTPSTAAKPSRRASSPSPSSPPSPSPSFRTC